MATSDIANTISEIERLTSRGKPTVVTWDRSSKSAVRVGHMAELAVGESKRLTVVRYFTPRRAQMTELVQRGFNSHLSLLFGHVEVEIGLEQGDSAQSPEFSAQIYVSDVDAHANVRIQHDSLEPFDSTALERYRTAQLVGLGNQWTESLFTMLDQEQERFDSQNRYDAAELARLNLTLEGY